MACFDCFDTRLRRHIVQHVRLSAPRTAPCVVIERAIVRYPVVKPLVVRQLQHNHLGRLLRQEELSQPPNRLVNVGIAAHISIGSQ